LSKEEKKSRKNQICLVIAIFALLVTISYRNSLINQEFNSIQNLKEDLSNLEKENKQLEIGIEGSLNLNNIEKIATEQLGMQKQTVGQTIYTELPKEDYVEAATEEIRKEKISLFEQFINIFK
jgi:cell division protein FtsL